MYSKLKKSDQMLNDNSNEMESEMVEFWDRVEISPNGPVVVSAISM